MKKLLLAALLATACTQFHPAQFAGAAGNRALPVLVHLEEVEGEAAIASNTDDAARMQAALDAVERRWQPFWMAWAIFEATQNAWAARAETGDATPEDEALVVDSFCALRHELPRGVPATMLLDEGIGCRR